MSELLPSQNERLLYLTQSETGSGEAEKVKSFQIQGRILYVCEKHLSDGINTGGKDKSLIKKFHIP